MTVEAYLRAQVPGYPFEIAVLENAALSPLFARPEKMLAVSLDDAVEEHTDNEEWLKSLKYATSTLYYSASGVFSGGSRSEQVGDVRASQSGFIITQADREYYRSMGDRLRGELGCEVEPDNTPKGCMFDASSLRKPSNYGRICR